MCYLCFSLIIEEISSASEERLLELRGWVSRLIGGGGGGSDGLVTLRLDLPSANNINNTQSFSLLGSHLISGGVGLEQIQVLLMRQIVRAGLRNPIPGPSHWYHSEHCWLGRKDSGHKVVEFCWMLECSYNYLGGNIIRTRTIIKVDVEVGVTGGLSLQLRVVWWQQLCQADLPSPHRTELYWKIINALVSSQSEQVQLKLSRETLKLKMFCLR